MRTWTLGGTPKHSRRIKWTALAAVLILTLWAASCTEAAPQKVSRTAFAMMGWRAVAAQDPDPQTRNPDYLAERLCDPAALKKRMGLSLDFDQTLKVINKRKSWIFYYATPRTKHMDASLVKAVTNGAKQVVVLGAGFDTRAYRFHKQFPQIRFFEVDLPAMVAYKKKLVKDKLGPVPPTVEYVPIDFNTQDLGQELAKAGYKKGLKTFFLWEGVCYYLDAAAVDSTLRFIAQNSAPGSSLAFDYLLPSVVSQTCDDPYGNEMSAYLKKIGEPLTFGIEPTKLAAYLQERGLKLESNLGPDDLVKRYMIGSNGKPLGTMTTFFWIADARVPGN